MPEISVPSSGRNKPPPRPLRRILADPRNTACSLNYSSSLFGIVPPSTLIITGTRFTLFIFHNSHSRAKNMFSVLMLAIEFGFSVILISSICDHGRTSFYNFLLLSLPTHQIRNWRVDVPLGHLLVFTVRLSKIRIKTV